MSRHFGCYRCAVVWTRFVFCKYPNPTGQAHNTKQVIVGVEAWVFKTVQMECHYDIYIFNDYGKSLSLLVPSGHQASRPFAQNCS